MHRRAFLGIAASAVGLSMSPAIGRANSAAWLDIPAQLGASAQFLPLVDALVAADLLSDLRAPGPFTMFAPSISAFEGIPYATRADLMRPAMRSTLRRILAFHVVEGRHSAFALTGRVTQLTTLIGRPLIVDGRGPGVRIGNTNVGLAEIKAANGVIHQIDRVLRPA